MKPVGSRNKRALSHMATLTRTSMGSFIPTATIMPITITIMEALKATATTR